MAKLQNVNHSHYPFQGRIFFVLEREKFVLYDKIDKNLHWNEMKEKFSCESSCCKQFKTVNS